MMREDKISWLGIGIQEDVKALIGSGGGSIKVLKSEWVLGTLKMDHRTDRIEAPLRQRPPSP